MISTQPPPPEGRIPPEGDTLFPPLRVYCSPGENITRTTTEGWRTTAGSSEPDARVPPAPFQSAFKEAMREIGAQS